MNKIFVLLFLMFIGLSDIAYAAPYCVNVQGMPSECHYYDADLCRQRASELSGLCKANLDEITLPDDIGNFCLVAEVSIISCIYNDFNSCESVAKKNKGVCTFNTNKTQPPESFESDVDDLY